MTANQGNTAEGNAQVEMMIGQVGGSVYHVHGDFQQVNQQVTGELAQRDYLLGLMTELRQEIAAARERAELSDEASAEAQRELDSATAEIDAAVTGDRSRLISVLERLKLPLRGAIDLAAKVGEIIMTVKSLR